MLTSFPMCLNHRNAEEDLKRLRIPEKNEGGSHEEIAEAGGDDTDNTA